MRIYRVTIGATAEAIATNYSLPLLKQEYGIDGTTTVLLSETDLIRALKSGAVRKVHLLGKLEQFKEQK